MKIESESALRSLETKLLSVGLAAFCVGCNKFPTDHIDSSVAQGGNSPLQTLRQNGTSVNGTNFPYLFVNDGMICVQSSDRKNTLRLMEGESPTWSPDGNNIAAVKQDSEHFCIVTLEPWLVRSFDFQSLACQWSPDARTVAVRTRDGRLLIIDPVANLGTTIAEYAEDIQFNWADKNTLFYMRGSAGVGAGEAFRYDVANKKETRLLGLARALTWSDTAENLAVLDSNGKVFLFNREGKAIGELPAVSNPYKGALFVDQQTLAWSPDAKKISFTVIAPQAWSISTAGAVLVYDFESNRWDSVVPPSASIIASIWSESSDSFFVETYSPLSYTRISDEGRPYKAEVEVSRLHPEALSKLGITEHPETELHRDQIKIHSLKGDVTEFAEGHALNIFHSEIRDSRPFK